MCLNLATDGSEDDLIHCIKEKQSYQAGREILKSQLSILGEEDVDPCKIEENDVAITGPEFLMVDSDHEDEEIDNLSDPLFFH